MLLDEMVSYLTSAGGFVAGVDLFAAAMPADHDPVLVVFKGAGRGSVKGMGNVAGQAAGEWPQLKVWARSESARLAEAYAEKAYHLLDGLPKRVIDGVQYHWASVVQVPYHVGTDAEGRKIYGFNVDIYKALSTTSTS